MLGRFSVLKRSNGLQQLHSLPSSSQVQWSKYESKNYLHFDNRKNIQHVKHLIQDSNWIEKHAFLPSIHFEIKFNKYVIKDTMKSEGIQNPIDLKEKKTKTRKIFYASHLDRFIYKYYGDLLNNAYNEYAVQNKIDHIALAYRNNKPGCNNIDFAKEVFNFILNQEQAVIISIDFTSFFDNINHKKLKENLKTVLGTSDLPNDFYNVFKSITQYSYINKSEIDKYLLKKYGKVDLKQKLKDQTISRIMSPKEFRTFKQNSLYKNKKPYGIPQGSGMSAVCSNIHLIDFDKELKAWATEQKALYRRYCDDLILVIPATPNDLLNVDYLISEVLDIVKKYKDDGLIIQKEKTGIRIYKNRLIWDEEEKQNKLDYLGFVIDGETVKIREKSLFKYYSRAYRKAKTCRKITIKTGKKLKRDKLYHLYTHLGFKYKKHGNFISYSKKAHEKMKDLPIKSLIKNQTKRHWSKIHSVLNTKD